MRVVRKQRGVDWQEVTVQEGRAWGEGISSHWMIGVRPCPSAAKKLFFLKTACFKGAQPSQPPSIRSLKCVPEVQRAHNCFSNNSVIVVRADRTSCMHLKQIRRHDVYINTNSVTKQYSLTALQVYIHAPVSLGSIFDRFVCKDRLH